MCIRDRIYVTHDQTEAMTLADRIVALDYGKIQQVGTPEELYDAPANKFVGGFIGSPKMNFLAGRVTEAGPESAEIALDAVAGEPSRYPATGLRAGDAVAVGVRPEDFEIDQTALDGKLVLKGTVDTADRLGNITYAYVKVAPDVVLTVQTFSKRKIPTGAEVTLSVSPERVSIFDPAGENCTGNTEK